MPQVSIALTLVAVTGLFTRSLRSTDAAIPGFDLDRTAFVSLNLAMAGYTDERSVDFYARLSSSLQASGAITSATVTDRLPLDIYGSQSAGIRPSDRVNDVGMTRSAENIQVGHVGVGYFDTLGIPIVRGRDFEAADERPGELAAIVSAAAARRFWPGLDAVGQRIRVGTEATGSTATVVGVAADAKVQTLGEGPQPFVYLPMRGGQSGLVRLIVRTTRDAGRMPELLRSEVRAIDPAVAVFEARSMTDYLGVMLYPYRLFASIGGVLGLLALGLSALGLYGVLACGVQERLREMAIRMALGASPRAIVTLVIASAARAAALGVAIGFTAALIAGRLLRGVLFGISPTDPVTLAAAAAALALVLLASSVGPIRRALRTDPAAVLRL